MATIAVNPFMMKDCLFAVESDNYEAHVSQVQFDPSDNAPVTFKGLTPSAVFSFGKNSTWTCTLTYAQDWNTADSMSRYLFEHEGEEIDVSFSPVNGGPAITATLIVVAGSIGGTVDNVATATVTLGVKGKPTLGAVVP